MKQRNDSASIYSSQNRADLAESEIAQMNVIREFLPAQLSLEELEAAVKEIISATGATSLKEMGKVMSVASRQLAGRAEGRAISEMVKKNIVVANESFYGGVYIPFSAFYQACCFSWLFFLQLFQFLVPVLSFIKIIR